MEGLPPNGETHLMGRFGFFLTSVSAMLLVLAGSSTVRAQEDVSGVVNAVSFYPMLESQPIFVRPLDDSPENLSIRTDMEQALTDAGFAVAKKSAILVLSFETRRELGGGAAPTRQVTNRFLERHEESDIGDQRYKPQIGKESPRGSGAISASRFRLDATLDDRETGKRLWRGWTIARMHGDDTSTLAKAMAPALVDSLGKTVRQQTFDIRASETSKTGTR